MVSLIRRTTRKSARDVAWMLVAPDLNQWNPYEKLDLYLIQLSECVTLSKNNAKIIKINK